MRGAGAGRRPLGSTYRLQLAELGFAGATRLVRYLDALGIETLYVSPVLAAVPGSTHGYDVVDPTRLDPSLGTEAEFEALLDALDGRGMRLLVDIVPNHMATHPDNAWWWETLREGAHGGAARIFDIDWAAQGGKVLVPTLGSPLREVCGRGGAAIATQGGEQFFVLDGQRFPLAGEPSPPGSATPSPPDLASVLERQHYRPAFWRLSAEEGNYRRFFDIDGLIGVRVEDPAVFDATHARILAMAPDERIAGWRIDHIDGLTDPAGYLGRLRGAVAARRRGPCVLLVEKILAKDEALRPSWECDGTTGYEFADVAGGLLVDAAGAARLAQAGAASTSDARTFSALALVAKGEMLARSFGAPLHRLSGLAAAALAADHPGHDLSRSAIEEAMAALTVHFDAYRTYLGPGSADPDDAARVRRAATAAAPTLGEEGRRALALLCDGMLVPEGDTHGGAGGAGWVEVAQRWQQLTGAVTAKGVEDTATYRFSGLLAHAEVGSDPGHPAVNIPAFHAATAARGRRHPSSLNATSTHDSKRSEDVRARLFALSEVADEWDRLTARWHRRSAGVLRAASGPDAHDELVAYQTLAAMWPMGRARMSAEVCARVQAYAVKAAREAKCRTGWTDPDERYERALRSFIRRLARSSPTTFGAEMERLVRRIGPAAATNSLALVVLKSVCPGVPDVYQGTELWDFSLTDPDNRRPVDFAARRALLATLPGDDAPAAARQAAAALLAAWEDGRIKLHVLRTLLALRRAQPVLFDRGSYHLARASGAGADHAVGILRRRGRQWVVALVPRLMLGLAGPGRFALGGRVWGDTRLHLPAPAPRELTDVVTGVTLAVRRNAFAVGQALDTLPVAVLRGVAPA